MNDDKYIELCEILDDFGSRIEEFVNSCESDEYREIVMNTVYNKTKDALQEIEHEIEVLELIESGLT